MITRQRIIISLLGFLLGAVLVGGYQFIRMAHETLQLRESITTNAVYHL